MEPYNNNYGQSNPSYLNGFPPGYPPAVTTTETITEYVQMGVQAPNLAYDPSSTYPNIEPQMVDNYQPQWTVRPTTKKEQKEFLKTVDIMVLFDESTSMGWKDKKTKTVPWNEIKEVLTHIVSFAVKMDQDGPEVGFFGADFKWIRGRIESPKKVERVFKRKKPRGTTNLTAALRSAAKRHFKRRDGEPVKKIEGNPDQRSLIVVITDGAPNSQKKVRRQITSACNKLDRNRFFDMRVESGRTSEIVKNTTELGILFFQVGSDPGATKFLTKLDDKLNLEVDIVDVKPLEELNGEDSIRECFVDGFFD